MDVLPNTCRTILSDGTTTCDKTCVTCTVNKAATKCTQCAPGYAFALKVTAPGSCTPILVAPPLSAHCELSCSTCLDND